MPSFSDTTGGSAERVAADRSVGPVLPQNAHFDAPLALVCGRKPPK